MTTTGASLSACSGEAVSRISALARSFTASSDSAARSTASGSPSQACCQPPYSHLSLIGGVREPTAQKQPQVAKLTLGP
jgi:hypothetical protein